MDEDNRSALVQVCAKTVERARENRRGSNSVSACDSLPHLSASLSTSPSIFLVFYLFSPLTTSDSNHYARAWVVHPFIIENGFYLLILI